MSETVTLVLFAAIAVVVLVQLYNVLGKRVGRQAEDVTEAEKSRFRLARREPVKPVEPVRDTSAPGVAALKGRDPAFDEKKFTEGARVAYETIVRAFAAGDRETLKPLLSPVVSASFDAAIAQRESAGRKETAEFLHPTRADLEEVELTGDVARARVRFLGEVRTRSEGPEGQAVDDRRTAEVWTFERPVSSRDPNWILVQVDAAEG